MRLPVCSAAMEKSSDWGNEWMEGVHEWMEGVHEWMEGVHDLREGVNDLRDCHG
jgi:hypothetical protein